MSMQNTFCKAMSNAVSLRIPGETNTLTFNPCCLYDDYLPFHPTIFARERKKFIEAESFLPGCSKCVLKETTHGWSQRTIFNQKIPNDIGSVVWKLEIVLDTTCNAACIQCGTTQSSLWRSEHVKAFKTPTEKIQDESQIGIRIEQIKKAFDLQKVKLFHFWGGEPFITDTHTKILQQIEDPSDVVVEYTTNGSVFPDRETWDLWSKFKEIHIAISIDGMQEQFYYIRWPLQWDKIAKNLDRYNKESTRNTRFVVNMCAVPMNMLQIPQLMEYIDKHFYRSPCGSPIKLHYIRSEGTVDSARTPMSFRELVWKTLGDDHDVSNILKELPLWDLTPMIKHLDLWDPLRKLNWRETFNEFAKHAEPR
jgi:sulfatase maturation enzyme AslB (radical SAM superfamily)